MNRPLLGLVTPCGLSGSWLAVRLARSAWNGPLILLNEKTTQRVRNRAATAAAPKKAAKKATRK